MCPLGIASTIVLAALIFVGVTLRVRGRPSNKPNPAAWGFPTIQAQQSPYDRPAPTSMALDRAYRDERIVMWRGVRRRLSGAGRRLPEASQETVERLFSEVEQALGKDK